MTEKVVRYVLTAALCSIAMSLSLPKMPKGTIGLPANLNTNPASIPSPISAPILAPPSASSLTAGPAPAVPGPIAAVPGPIAAVPGPIAAAPTPSGPGAPPSLGSFNLLSSGLKKQLVVFKEVDFEISPTAFGLDFNTLEGSSVKGLTQSNCGKKCIETDDCVMALHCLKDSSPSVTTAVPCVFEIGKPPCTFNLGDGKSRGGTPEYCYLFKETPTQGDFGNDDFGSNCTYVVYHPNCRDPKEIPETWKPAIRRPAFSENSSVVTHYECQDGYSAEGLGVLIATCHMDGKVDLKEDYKCIKSGSGDAGSAPAPSLSLLPVLTPQPLVVLTNGDHFGAFNQRPQITVAPATTTTATPAPTTTTTATPAPTTTTTTTTTTPAPTTTTTTTTTTPAPTTTTTTTTTTPAPTTTTTTTTTTPTTTTTTTTTTPAPTTTTTTTTTTPAPTTTTTTTTTTPTTTTTTTTTTPAPTTTTTTTTTTPTTTTTTTTTTPAPTTTTTTTTPAPTTTTTTTTPAPTTTTTTTTPAPTTTTTPTTTPAPTTTTTTTTTPAPTTTTTTTTTTSTTTTSTTSTTTTTPKIETTELSDLRPLDCMNGYIYDHDANLCFQVYTGYVLSFDNAQYMCNYLTGGTGGLATLSTTKKFKAVQHYLRDERTDGTYFWVGSEQWQNWDYYSFYRYVYNYYYGWVENFYFYDYNYWSDSHKVDYKLWATGEPSGDYEQCNAITRRKDLELMDSSCSYKFDYICDIPVLEPDRPWQCDSDYVFHRESNLCFKIVHLEANPYQAQDKCSSDGYGRGRLAVLNTMEKFNYVKEHLIELGETRPYLVGATQTSMWWEWNEWNDGTPVDAAAWALGEPNSIYEDCADLRRDMDYKMNDISCSYGSLYFICDIPI